MAAEWMTHPLTLCSPPPITLQICLSSCLIWTQHFLLLLAPHLVLPDFPGSRQWLPAWWVHVVSPKPHPHSRSWDIGAPLRRGRPVKMPQPPISIWVGNIISTLHDWWACLNASYAVCRAPALPPSLVWGVPCARENSLLVLTPGGIAELSHLRPPILGSESVQINQESKRTQKEEWFVP